MDGELVPNTAERKGLERMKELRSETKPNGKPMHGYASIATELNADGIPSKTGGQWYASSVHKVLTAA